MSLLERKNLILGAGMTGLAAGYASGWPVLEAADHPGGLCASYGIKPGSCERSHRENGEDHQDYRFEIGGGHWIFGFQPSAEEFLRSFVPLKSYARKAAVFFSKSQQSIPYPIQNNLRFLEAELTEKILEELEHPTLFHGETLKESLETTFGPTLFSLFFGPFNDRYTAGLYDRIAPQDDYKIPINLEFIHKGARGQSAPVGYNTVFYYPEGGLGALSQKIAERCDIRYRKKAVRIDLEQKCVFFEEGSREHYRHLFSTLPLNQTIAMSGLEFESDPYTSILVVNIGALRGKRTPEDHWVYVPDSQSGFHRVGFYSNVDPSFLPKKGRDSRVSLYVERSFPGGCRPSGEAMERYKAEMIQELQSWGFIAEVEVLDLHWVEMAYTWKYPHSDWRAKALERLKRQGVFSMGRYGRWHFQGIAESIQEGLNVHELLEGRSL